MEGQKMTPTGGTFLDIPTKKGFWTAFIVVVVFMGLAGLLYGFADKSLKDYAAKIGDCFIQGAIISIMFAILKAMIDKVGPFRGS
jgi:preprotein translocase subunit SecY